MQVVCWVTCSVPHAVFGSGCYVPESRGSDLKSISLRFVTYIMQQPWVSIDLEADPQSAKVLTSPHAPTPWPEVGLLAAQSELRLQLFPALEARHTSESAALFRGHRLDRESLDRRYDEDSAEMEARHHSERAALVDNYRAGHDVLEKQFAADSADMQSKQLSETQAFLQQNLHLHRDMIAALAQQRKHQQEVKVYSQLV